MVDLFSSMAAFMYIQVPHGTSALMRVWNVKLLSGHKSSTDRIIHAI
uniref:Uncharacterized protein n=1 Tax=Anguilla anguilla TaxID=7936 RepID=A0A0E9Q8M0_ANGAN